MIFRILLVCATCLAVTAQAQNHDPATPPAVAAKVSLRGDAIGVRVSEMRITRPNDILVVQADFGNAERTDRMVFYRFKWLDAVGNQVGDGESWKQLTVLGLGQQTVKSVAPAGVATDFRLEMYVNQ
jgi:uncharacterized protein YcfL